MTQLGVPRRYAAVFRNGASLPADHEFAAYFTLVAAIATVYIVLDTVQLRPSADHSLYSAIGGR